MELASADAWRAALIDAFPHTEVKVRGGDPPTWEYRATSLGELSVHRVEAGPQHVRHPARSKYSRTWSLMAQLEGRCRVAIDGARVDLGAGQLVLAPIDRDLELEADGPYRQIFVLIPAARLGALPRGAVGQPTRPDSAVDRMVFEHVAALPGAAPLLDRRQTRLAVDALLAHVRLSTPVREGLRIHGSSRLERALAFIDEHLGDPELTPRAVAQAQGVGRRHLDEVFRSAGATVAQAIWERRMARAAHLLRDPAWRDVSVLGVGLECGFSSASHFSRSFRARHGVTPSTWRATPRRTRPSTGKAVVP